jgi:hypothetical protein
MWAIGFIAFTALLSFVDWFFALFLAGCVMGGYGGVLVPLLYDGESSRDADGDFVWMPKQDSESNEPHAPQHAVEKSGSVGRILRTVVFPSIVLTMLVYLAIDMAAHE